MKLTEQIRRNIVGKRPPDLWYIECSYGQVVAYFSRGQWRKAAAVYANRKAGKTPIGLQEALDMPQC